jgi:hypothetical protein
MFFTAARASAAAFGGNSLDIGWTGGAAFGPYFSGGGGSAHAVFAVPASGSSGSFSTAPFASSTGTSTSVSDTNIRIVNNGQGGWFPPQWFQYVDINNTLPDFRNWTFTLDSANTTEPGFNIATQLQVQQNAIAIEFGEIQPSQVISINVTVPEPASLCVLPVAYLLLRRRCVIR